MRLECDFELPELGPPTDSREHDWRVESRQVPPPPIEGRRIGEDTVYGAIRVRAFSAADGFRLVFDDTGTFDVRPLDRVIAWYRGPDASDAAVRADLLGRVIAVAVHAAGGLALHASAVSIDGRAVAFLGPKHAGKSTTALALVRRGARLITDDTLVVCRIDAEGAWVAPGVQRIRLWEDSARALDAARTARAGVKPTIEPLAPFALEPNAAPFAACYVIQAASGEVGEAGVVRDRMSPVQATMAAVRFGKLGPLLGGSEAAAVLQRAGRLTGVTPFFAAAVSRDLTRLDDVAAQVIEWQSATRVPGASGRP